ncbi:MAG TPA: hypothetical protein VN905_11295, partial [Candidatus Binatia bacterium]|nr:hypothetical protein [Candidatus Binatia bacterium]
MRRDASFVVGIWLLSRAVILVSMLVIAPTLPQPADGHVAARSWSTFLYADGALYQSIVLDGYQYEKDRGTHPAYFPLYPLVAAPFVRFAHIPFAIVGPLLNGAAFLLALLALFAWTRARHGPAAARWTIATAAFLPLSIYGTLAYTEGLFLLLSTLALWSFERDRFAGAAVWGALASATRFPGLALMPAFALEAVLQKRSRGAWIAALCACAGTLAYALFCWRSFGDPFAFVHAQIAWRGPLTVRFADWEYMVAILLGTVGPHWWPYQIAIVALSALWWLKRGSFSDAGNFVCGLLLGLAEAALWFTSQWDLL